MRACIAIAMVVLAGCNAILGIEAVSTGERDAADADAAIDGASDAGDATVGQDAGDAAVIDGAIDAAIDSGMDAAIDAPGLDAPPGCTIPTGLPDEDMDGYRDACDNCPYFPPAAMADDDLDGVGNLCDPRPGLPDRLVAFYGFGDGLVPPGMSFHTSGPGTWTVGSGQLRLTGTQGAQHHYLARVDVGLRDVNLVTQFTTIGPPSAPIASTSRGFGLWASVDSSTTPLWFPTGILVETYEQTSATGTTTRATHIVSTNPVASAGLGPADDLFVFGRAYRMHLNCFSTPARCDGFVTFPGMGFLLGLDPATTRVGSVGLRWFAVDAAADYLAIYAPN